MNVNENLVTLQFDPIDGKSPLIISLDIKRYADTSNRQKPSTIRLKRPSDVYMYTPHMYISNNDQGNQRSRLQIVPYKNTPIHTIMITAAKTVNLNPSKKIHKFGHGSAREIEDLMNKAAMIQAEQRGYVRIFTTHAQYVQKLDGRWTERKYPPPT